MRWHQTTSAGVAAVNQLVSGPKDMTYLHWRGHRAPGTDDQVGASGWGGSGYSVCNWCVRLSNIMSNAPAGGWRRWSQASPRHSPADRAASAAHPAAEIHQYRSCNGRLADLQMGLPFLRYAPKDH